jgi:hypothetical protein
MERFRVDKDPKDQFQRFERAAAKGHEESIWILSVVKDTEMEDRKALKEAFAQTEEPLGWYFAGLLSTGLPQRRHFKKSADGGCSWGLVRFSMYLNDGGGGKMYVVQDEKVYVEWLEKAAQQNNPKGMYLLGNWFGQTGRDRVRAISCYHSAAALGSKRSMEALAGMLMRTEEGYKRDIKQAAKWGAKAEDDSGEMFWFILKDTERAWKSGMTQCSGVDFDLLCYALGWGLYWHVYGSAKHMYCSDREKAFAGRCLDFYCKAVEAQRESIFMFLLCWKASFGVKEVEKMVAQMVWEGREDRLVRSFEEE